MHRLASAFVLGYHGCDQKVAAALLDGKPFKHSDNAYDWLGPGIYFWEANPVRGLEFAAELKATNRGSQKVATPAVVGAVIDLGLCLDLTTSAAINLVRDSYEQLRVIVKMAKRTLPKNSPDLLKRNLDCAVIQVLHEIRETVGDVPFDTVRGIFTEGGPIFQGSGFQTKTHVQICVRNPECIKGVFRVPDNQLK